MSLDAEITESTVLNEQITGDYIEDLKEAGFEVAIDDFGTGYSSIQRLKDMGCMTLKVDQSYVRDIEDPQAYSFLKAIINLAQLSSDFVIVEGVETLQQKLLLMKMGVRYCQGYHYGKPLAISDMEAYLDDQFGISVKRSDQYKNAATSYS